MCLKISLLELEILHLQKTMEQERANAKKESDAVDILIVCFYISCLFY
jgi:hypothetical protein